MTDDKEQARAREIVEHWGLDVRLVDVIAGLMKTAARETVERCAKEAEKHATDYVEAHSRNHATYDATSIAYKIRALLAPAKDGGT